MVIPVGKLHGPGNVGSVPDFLLNAGSWMTPPADPAAAGRSGPHACISGRVAGLKAADDPGMNEETIKFFISGMLSGNAKLQRYIVDNYTLPNVEFMHIQGSTRGQENYYNTFRGATGLMDYRSTAVRDMIVTGEKACVWLDLKIRTHSLLPAVRRNFPCLVWFVFKPDPIDGRVKVALQHDHHSFFVITWMGGVGAAWLHEAILRPLMGWFIVWQGIFFDKLKAALQASFQALGLQPPNLEQDGGLSLCLAPLYPDKPQMAGSVPLSPRDIDRCVRKAALGLREQGMLVGHESIAELEPLPGMGWITHMVNAFMALMGLLSFIIMMTIGVTFAYFGPMPHIFP